jgi:hypothetical protein
MYIHTYSLGEQGEEEKKLNRGNSTHINNIMSYDTWRDIYFMVLPCKLAGLLGPSADPNSKQMKLYAHTYMQCLKYYTKHTQAHTYIHSELIAPKYLLYIYTSDPGFP